MRPNDRDIISPDVMNPTQLWHMKVEHRFPTKGIRLKLDGSKRSIWVTDDTLPSSVTLDKLKQNDAL